MPRSYFALRPALGLLLLFAGALLGGCTRSLNTIDHARQAFAMGDLTLANETLSELVESRSRFCDAASLDLAIVDLAAGDIAASQSRLRQLRDRFDQLPKVSISGEAASVITDDTARLYRPAGYEEVMIRAMLSVCSLAGDATDAESYALQATMKETELRQEAAERGMLSAAERYQAIALAPYLRGILREATHHDFDDAARAYQLVSAVRPQFAPASADLARATEGAHSSPGNGVLYVIACVGRGPQRRETIAPTTSTALSIASSVLNAETNKQPTSKGDRVEGPVLPNIAQVKVPTVVIPPTDVVALGVRVDGTLYGATQTLTDVGELATRQLEAEMPWTIARAVVRRATKEAAVAKIGDTFGLGGSVGSLFHFAAASAWSAAEQADTRCWGLLPREIQVLRAELPSGTHQLSLEPLRDDGTRIRGRDRSVEIIDGENCYVVVIAPTETIYVVGR